MKTSKHNQEVDYRYNQALDKFVPIKEEIYDIVNEEPQDFEKSFAEKVLGKTPTQDYSKNKMIEKEYRVEYWWRKGDLDDFEVIVVKAATDDEAIQKAKEGAHKGAIDSTFKIIKSKD